MSFQQWWQDFSIVDIKQLTLPKKLKIGRIQFLKHDEECKCELEATEQQDLPFSESVLFTATAHLDSRYTHRNGKETMLLDLAAQEIENVHFEPGDTIGILPKNNDQTISEVLKQLKIDNINEMISISNCDPKKKYLPRCCNIQSLLEKYVNFKGIPMKQMLVTLADYTKDEREKSAMLFLASKEGVDIYKSLILDGGVDFITLFTNFPSCCPEVEVLIEMLPRLMPRPYSIASSKLFRPDKLRIAFSILPSEGVCTGMFRRAFCATSNAKVNMYFRKTHGFRLADNETAPLILVGPGLGVAPFLGFLEKLTIRKNITYLFTGFQFKENYFCLSELEEHKRNGVITKLFVTFSRESNVGPKYVQEAIREQWEDLGDLIVNKKALIFECGNFKKKTETVYDAFTEVLATYMDINLEEARLKLDKIKKEGRYLQDIWY